MKKSYRTLVAGLVLLAAGGSAISLSLPAAAAEVVVVDALSAPPPVRYEAVPEPRAGYVWDRGHWRWQRGHYVWVTGHWQAERVGYHWVPGHWVAHGPHWRWMPGHWA